MSINRPCDVVPFFYAPDLIGVEREWDKCSGTRFGDNGIELLSAQGEYLTFEILAEVSPSNQITSVHKISSGFLHGSHYITNFPLSDSA
jgi:hypothetical protein